MAHQLLLADDSVTIQRVIKLTFADEDVEVTAVGDGNQAVASIDRQPPDIVLADVAMPGRTGYEVAQHIRTSPRLSHIPVLLLTGAFDAVDEARASEAGCDGVLAKPFEPEVVVSRVKELLAKPRPAVVAPTPALVDAAPIPAAPPVAVPVPAPVATVPEPLPFPVKTVSPAAVAAAPRSTTTDVDAYFDRLDQAFATLALSPRPSSPAPAEAPVAVLPTMPAPAAAAVAPFAPKSPAPLPAPVPAPETPATPPALTDAQLELIVTRVLDRLSERLGVDAARIVADVAERLVKDEIAAIKRRV